MANNADVSGIVLLLVCSSAALALITRNVLIAALALIVRVDVWRSATLPLIVRVLVANKAVLTPITREFTRATVAGTTRCDSVVPTE